jgi:hypothetical protein
MPQLSAKAVEIHVHMLSFALLRPARRLVSAPPSTRARTEVCPPSLLDSPEPALRRALRWLAARPMVEDASLRRLQTIREEFAIALEDLDSQHAKFLQHRIRHIRSLRELWHVRSEMFGLIARARSQEEAERRIMPLNRHFPTRSPKSGFAPLAD